MKRLALLLLLVAGPAVGEEQRPLSAKEFEALVTGRTYFYTWLGQSYGAEQYLPGRKVIWAFTGDDCTKGEWFVEGEEICFIYEGDADTHCWTYSLGPEGLIALSRNREGAWRQVARQSSPESMKCLGPDVGV